MTATWSPTGGCHTGYIHCHMHRRPSKEYRLLVFMLNIQLLVKLEQTGKTNFDSLPYIYPRCTENRLMLSSLLVHSSCLARALDYGSEFASGFP